jgi:hypothetical protein
MSTPYGGWTQVSPDLRYGIFVDEECYDDSYIDTWDDLDEQQKLEEKKALWRQIESEGVWGFVVQRRVPAIPKCSHCGQETPEHWDDDDVACWGIIGFNETEKEARESLRHLI